VLTPLLVALTLSAPAAPAAPAPDAKAERRRAEIAKQILQLAGQLQRDIEAGNVAALVARVPATGLRCAGARVPRAHVEQDLRSEGTWLHGVIFGGPGVNPPGPDQPASLKALFATAKEIAVVVEFREDSSSEVGMPCFDYHARDTITPGAPFCFEWRSGKWWFTESLYPC
jgi:hypothetical protein